MEKKEKLLQQLLAYAGKRKILTYLSMIIAGIGQLLALAPFIYIWAIIRDVIGGDYSRAYGACGCVCRKTCQWLEYDDR